jgi:hypothetical protein
LIDPSKPLMTAIPAFPDLAGLDRMGHSAMIRGATKARGNT